MYSLWKHTSRILLTVPAMLGGLGARADVLGFDAPIDTSFAPFAPLFTHGDEFTQAGYVFDPFSNQDGALQGVDLVGALVDGAHLADTCMGVACPVGNTSTFYAGVNDGVLAMGRSDGQLFTLAGFDVGFVGAMTGADFPSNTPLVMKVQGTRADNSTLVATVVLAGPAGGSFQFQSASLSAAFQAIAFKEIFFYGLPCDTGGNCTGFNSNLGQFALDNINVAAASPVPEPGSLLLMCLGLFGIAACTRGRKR